jgi:hypothetical protein
MQPMNHPDDERLAALAASEADAAADGSLVEHVSGCPRCAPMVEELRTLRSALAELPDITPSRPLRLLPHTPEPTARRSGWLSLLRGVTAPAMAVAILMIVVGALGTVVGTGCFACAGAGAPAPLNVGARAGAAAESGPAVPAALTPSGKSAAPVPSSQLDNGYGALRGTPSASPHPEELQSRTSTSRGPSTSNPRPPFDVLLGAGVVLLAAAFLARGYVRRRTPV